MGSGEEFPPAKDRSASSSKPIPEGNEGNLTLNTSPGNSETLPRNKKNTALKNTKLKNSAQLFIFYETLPTIAV